VTKTYVAARGCVADPDIRVSGGSVVTWIAYSVVCNNYSNVAYSFLLT